MAKASQRASGPSSTMRSAAQRGMDDPVDPKDVLQEALRRADEAWEAEKQNIVEGRDCQRFYAGDQWDVLAKSVRMQDSRPTLTINRLPQFVRQMTGDVRKNPPALKFLPAKGKASQETAEALNGLCRHIEQQSQAKDCYIKAVENAAVFSQGFFKIVTEYSDDDGFEQDIRIRPIHDPAGALIDPFAQLFDKSDMRYGFTFDQISLEEFKKDWPDKAIADVPGSPGVNTTFPWRINNTVRIAAYWRKMPVTKTIYLMPDQTVVDDQKLKGMSPEVQKIVQDGVKLGEIRTREVETHKVEMWRISGKDVLSGPHEWAGRYIPICMVAGEEITMDGSTVRKGMVHDARDPQRIYNYSRSASVEAVALQPKAPFIGTVDMFRNRPEWATAGSKNHAYLAYNPDPKALNQRPERSQPAIASQGLDAQSAIASEDMKAVTGIYDAALGARSNEQSGIAIARRQQEGDTATYLYPDNLAKAIGYAGKILADLIPRVYDTERQVRILKEDGTAEMVTVNATKPQVDDKGKTQPFYDLSAGEYDVAVTVGPTFATQKAEAFANMVELARGMPIIGQAAPDLVVKYSDAPGADEMAARLKRALPPQLTEDTDGPPQPPPPPPDVVADVEKTIAERGKIEAETQGKQIENVTAVMQLQAMGLQMTQMAQAISGLHQLLAGGAPMPPGAPVPPPGPGPVVPAPPPAPDMPMPEMPMGEGGDMPPMVEVESLPNGVGPV